ncbi:hypothetical protein ASG89_23360 [Paenibacillus sp. Soil766]|uniref:stalk domain-containing protein n=1 Tax=Paenibacillus sp. Soil766 TaxID=1736404 RepID=UPI000708C6E2|nr:stalk domain-containing protein [Paenibacillus sp. Soil766]KRF03381.1 hypothetical protein ASG89_23360 [Paenibacillus sp. Soil766]
MKKIIIMIMILQLFLFSNVSSAQENLVSPAMNENDILLITKGLSNDEILKLDYRSEILANALRTQSIADSKLRAITNAFLTPFQKGIYGTNSGHPKGTPPSPKEPERIPMKVKFNGNLMNFENEQLPIFKNGVTLIPLRVIFEALGAEIEWNQDSYSVTATKDNTTIKLSVGDTNAIVNGAVVKLELPSEIINNKTMIPLRFVSEALGAKVDWINYSRTVLIYNELLPQTFAYVNIGQFEHNIENELGYNYKEIISAKSHLPVWRYDDKVNSNYSISEKTNVTVDFQGLMNGSLRTQLFVYWKAGSDSTFPVVDHFVLYHLDQVDQKIHEYHVKHDQTIEEVILNLKGDYTPSEQLQSRIELTTLHLLETAGRGNLTETTEQVDTIAPSDLNLVFLQIFKMAHMFKGNQHVSDLVDLLINKQVDLNIVDESNSYTPLHYAAERAINLTESLLDGNAKVNVSANGMTPLMQVSSKKQLGLVNKMLAMGADPNLGRGALIAALHPYANSDLTDESVQIVENLIAYKADVNTANADGETPLMSVVFASTPQSRQIVQMLLEHGADPLLMLKSNWSGLTPLMRAVDPYIFNSAQVMYDIIEMLINANADVNAVDEKGNSVLAYAVEFNQHSMEGNAEVIRLLLSNGSKTQTKDKNGVTPLEKAKTIVDEKLRAEIVMLLEGHANMN